MARLSEDDGRAVDFFLEARSATKSAWGAERGDGTTGDGDSDGGSQNITAMPPRTGDRLVYVEQLFGVLQELRTSDPPADLLTRTLGTIESDVRSQRARAGSPARPMLPPELPMGDAIRPGL